MEVRSEHCIDAGEKDADGYYDYYYAWTLVTFREGDVEFGFRIYDDSPAEAVFRSIIEGGLRTGVKLGRPQGTAFRELPRGDALLKRAAVYLRDELGVQTVSVYDGQSGGYAGVPVQELT